MNTMLNIKNLDGNSVLKHGGNSKNHEAEVTQEINYDVSITHKKFEAEQLEVKSNTDSKVKEQGKVHLGIKKRANIIIIGVPSQEGIEGNVTGRKKVKEVLGKLTWKGTMFGYQGVLVRGSYIG
ncbi:hypothetical protein Tco_0368706 [Tanacetum coccineum]